MDVRALGSDGLVSTLGGERAYDLVICSRFFDRRLLPGVQRLAAVGGFVLIAHFLRGAEVLGHPSCADELIERGELPVQFDSSHWDIVVCDESVVLPDTRPFCHFLARRKA